jgi:hypothetical protein
MCLEVNGNSTTSLYTKVIACLNIDSHLRQGKENMAKQAWLL